MDITQIVADLKAEVNRLENAITALLGLGGAPRRGRPPKSQVSQSATGKRTMSPAARKLISAAMKLRWAQRLGKFTAKEAAVPAKKTARKPMSPAMKKKMSALMKKRWAEKKKAGAKSL